MKGPIQKPPDIDCVCVGGAECGGEGLRGEGGDSSLHPGTLWKTENFNLKQLGTDRCRVPPSAVGGVEWRRVALPWL
jgi:hypothetical protein